jgi:hypothetical protein
MRRKGVNTNTQNLNLKNNTPKGSFDSNENTESV